MAGDVERHERAQRRDREPLPTSIFQGSADERAAEAATLARLVHLRVREGDHAVAAVVRSEADQAAVEAKLVAARVRHVNDNCVGDRTLARLELVRAAEVLD